MNSPYPRPTELLPEPSDRKKILKGRIAAATSLGLNGAAIITVAWCFIGAPDTLDRQTVVGTNLFSAFIPFLGLVMAASIVGFLGKKQGNRWATGSYRLAITLLAAPALYLVATFLIVLFSHQY